MLVRVPLKAEYAASPDGRHTNCCVRYTNEAQGIFNDMMIVALNQNALDMNSADTRVGAGAIGVWVNQTFSRGSVQLVSSDPTVHPTVQENMLSDERDLASPAPRGSQELSQSLPACIQFRTQQVVRTGGLINQTASSLLVLARPGTFFIFPARGRPASPESASATKNSSRSAPRPQVPAAARLAPTEGPTVVAHPNRSKKQIVTGSPLLKRVRPRLGRQR